MKEQKWFCKCVLPSEEIIYLVIRAHTEGQASERAHNGYAIDYVEDIYTPLQMEYRKRHLRPHYYGGQALV